VLQEGVGNHGHQCVTMKPCQDRASMYHCLAAGPSFTNFYFTLNGTYSTHYELN
jgi:hypothetical protein